MNDILRPIRLFAFVLIGIAVINALLFSRPFLDPESSISIFGGKSKFVFYVWSFFELFNLATAFGILYLKRWGYRLFKIYLYLLLLGFPIGTFIAYKFLNYLKRHDIEKYFGRHLDLSTN